MSLGENSQDCHNAIIPTSVDICRPVVSVEMKLCRPMSFKFSVFLFYMEGNQTRFVESSDSDIRKLVANAVPESTKKLLSTRGSVASLLGQIIIFRTISQLRTLSDDKSAARRG